MLQNLICVHHYIVSEYVMASPNHQVAFYVGLCTEVSSGDQFGDNVLMYSHNL